MGQVYGDDEEFDGVKMWANSPTCSRTGFQSPTFSMSEDVNVTMDKIHEKSSLSAYVTRRRKILSLWNLSVLLFLLSVISQEVGGDAVYVRSGDFGQLVTSSTSRWFKGVAKDPLMLKKQNGATGVICRVYHTTLRGVGLVSEEAEGTICNIDTHEGSQGSDKFQTISESASRLVWTLWKRPNPPPTGAVAVSVKPQKFFATDLNSTVIGYLDPTLQLGSAIFPNQAQPSASCLVLTEIEPIRYELSDIQLKRNKGFIEEDIVLAYGHLSYKEEDPKDKSGDDWYSRENIEHHRLKSDLVTDEHKDIKKGRVESILSYETNNFDYWGQGFLMAKGLHTTIHLPNGITKILEWGIPNTVSGKTETMTAVADLYPGTAINVTLHGTRLNGENSYWASLKTFFKDGSSSTRLMDNHRKVIEIQDIRLEHSKPYFISNNSIVPEPTTTTTTTTTTFTPETEEEADDQDISDGTEEGNALPVESNPYSSIQADQQSGLHLTADNMKSKAASVVLGFSHFSSFSLTCFTAFMMRIILSDFTFTNYFLT